MLTIPRRNLIFAFCLLALTLIFESAHPEERDKVSTWKIVNYWSIRCGPCRIEIPELNRLSEELAPRNVPVLGINFDDDPRNKTLEIAKHLGIEFPTLTFAEIEELQLEAPSALPTTYILSPNNEVKAKLVGPQDRLSLIAKLAEFRSLD